MTVCGFIVTRDSALVWGDTEQYLAGRPTADLLEKVVASPGGLTAVSTGYSSLCAKARQLVTGLGGATKGSALRLLPHELRQACADQHAHCRALGARYEVSFALGLIGPCGYGMRGAVFVESANFEPRETFTWLSPDVRGAPPATAQEVLSVAQRQLRLVRNLYPGATGKTLTVLRVGRLGIAKRSVPLMIGDELAA
jgi:hypothetical protein